MTTPVGFLNIPNECGIAMPLLWQFACNRYNEHRLGRTSPAD